MCFLQGRVTHFQFRVNDFLSGHKYAWRGSEKCTDFAFLQWSLPTSFLSHVGCPTFATSWRPFWCCKERLMVSLCDVCPVVYLWTPPPSHHLECSIFFTDFFIHSSAFFHWTMGEARRDTMLPNILVWNKDRDFFQTAEGILRIFRQSHIRSGRRDILVWPPDQYPRSAPVLDSPKQYHCAQPIYTGGKLQPLICSLSPCTQTLHSLSLLAEITANRQYENYLLSFQFSQPPRIYWSPDPEWLWQLRERELVSMVLSGKELWSRWKAFSSEFPAKGKMEFYCWRTRRDTMWPLVTEVDTRAWGYAFWHKSFCPLSNIRGT